MHIEMNMLFTLGSLLGLLIGGGLLKLVSHIVQGKIQFMYAICGGILLGLLFFDILPSTWHVYDLKGVLLGIVVGYMMMLCVDLFLHRQNIEVSPLQSLILLTVAIFFHNYYRPYIWYNRYTPINLCTHSYSFTSGPRRHGNHDGPIHSKNTSIILSVNYIPLIPNLRWQLMDWRKRTSFLTATTSFIN